MSNMPRTDDTYFRKSATMYDMAGEMKRMERELNAANESFRKLNIHALELTDHIRRLKNAGDAIEKLLPEGSIYDKAAIRWIKTKNDKL